MLFRCDKTLERTVYSGDEQLFESTPARTALFLVRALDDWFAIPHRTLYQPGENHLQVGYGDIAFSTLEYAESFGTLAAMLVREWSMHSFGIAPTGELMDISFVEKGSELVMRQHGTSGEWCDTLQGLYLDFTLPEAEDAACMARLFTAMGWEMPGAALDWKHASFLTRQKLSDGDRTLSFCYVTLDRGAEDENLCRLRELTLAQKRELWRLFLEKRVYSPEFEWLWRALSNEEAPDLPEWHLALYQELEALGFRFVSRGNQFELMDRTGKRMYFGVDHAGAAERVLMKILFPLNR